MQEVDEFERVIRLNATGTFLTAKYSLPHLIESKGSFVGMSSFAGAYTHRYFTGYTAGKGGLEQVVRNAADEYGAVGVRFNAIRPGLHQHRDHGGHLARRLRRYESYLVNTPLRTGRRARRDRGRRAVPARSASRSGSPARSSTSTVATSLRSGPDYGELVVMMHGPDAIPGASGS